jgi:chaperonin cofactor prefoldin
MDFPIFTSTLDEKLWLVARVEALELQLKQAQKKIRALEEEQCNLQSILRERTYP